MEDPIKKKNENNEEFMEVTEFNEFPVDAYLIKHEEFPAAPVNCTLALSIGGSFLSHNESMINFPVHVRCQPNDPGIDFVSFTILAKYYLFRNTIPFSPPVRLDLLLAEAVNQEWVVSTCVKEITDVNGNQIEKAFYGSKMERFNGNCPTGFRVVRFSFPVELVRDKYVKFVVRSRCCGPGNAINRRVETKPRFHLLSNP